MVTPTADGRISRKIRIKGIVIENKVTQNTMVQIFDNFFHESENEKYHHGARKKNDLIIIIYLFSGVHASGFSICLDIGLNNSAWSFFSTSKHYFSSTIICPHSGVYIGGPIGPWPPPSHWPKKKSTEKSTIFSFYG